MPHDLSESPAAESLTTQPQVCEGASTPQLDDGREADGTQHASDQEPVDHPLELGNGPHLPVPKNKKKKRGKNKSTAQRGPTALPKGRGSGFEEYYADPPMTPQEAMEEKTEIYSLDLAFEERIQSCIQRFRSRRRMSPVLRTYFDEYLFHGGINTSSNAFGGQDPGDLKQLTPAQRREITATDSVQDVSVAGCRFYNGDREHWSVDFTGVAAGFFSTVVPYLTGSEESELQSAVSVVENFLRYVLQHDVCPEYEADVQRALALCDIAREEWPEVHKIQELLPGQFNLAATELFSTQAEGGWSSPGLPQPAGFNAKIVFYATLALMNEPRLLTMFQDTTAQAVREFDCTLEVVNIILPSLETIKRCELLHINNVSHAMSPTGKAILKTATIEDEWDHPQELSPLVEGESVTLYFDETILSSMKPGMKLSLRLCELDQGLRFVKSIIEVVPSFHTFLPQSMMRYFKQPQENDRPAPSVRDPGAEDAQMNKDD